MAVNADRFQDSNPKTCVVLGGRGFIGKSLVLQLLKLGNWIVRIADSTHSLNLHHSESLLAEALSSSRASYFHLDLTDKHRIAKVLEGSSVVFYFDVDSSNNGDHFCSLYKLIVQGAKNVIIACRESKVKRLIYNSSADVVFDRDKPLAYPWKVDNMLIDLKAQAEALILNANDIDGVLTCSLRSSNVFGPGDSELVPFFLKLARYGFTKFIIGTGDNLTDFTFSENVAHAHICAEEALNFQTVSVAGKAFFITNLEPMKFWKFLSLLLEGLGYRRPFIKLPANLVQYVLSVLKWLYEKSGPGYFNYPLLVHFIQLALHTRTFNCSAAQKYIAYAPIVSLEEGVTLTIESFSHLAKDSSFSRCCDRSKADKLLGSGKVADILLWRNEKASFTCFLGLVFLFYWFFLSGSTFISSAARLLLFATLLLCGHGFLPSKLFGFSIQRVPGSNFKISDTAVKDSVTITLHLWNKGFQNIKGLAQGDDWSIFFKVAGFLYLLKLFLSKLLTTLIGVGLVFAFMVFFVYEQYESEIDGLVDILITISKEFMVYLMRNLPVSVSRLLHYGDNFQHYQGPECGKDLR
ncbi:putative 3-beta-hydroxysteroid-4-alpha-carboxylate 3-dehydrogenase (decarboxylating) [Medicago truncatula]|uniref:Reticulon-like protein n=1 Tax=Medicago truncatula TaxID=3880 RepID=G7JEW0_MEDTR|nr:3beta-hydroxysteroid-dehydrogenase/decarboxylase isoform X1 [Medicago truncatula]AES89018.2 3beta-hydroxysteroid-dehydrogenase/decarboxylase [Medicago truncatula]RHN61168.1 putative 3-beta-hydroxysteroid-4-alpha-carboxylate 3-dehydrogenase (decarboxylating) [Medicago truncatula]